MDYQEQNHPPDLEMGDHGKPPRDGMYYVRDFTYRVVPLCALILVFFSDGAILVCTLAFDKPIPRQGAIVVSGILAVLFLLFGIGGMYIYHRRYYPLPPKGSPPIIRSRPPSNTQWHRRLTNTTLKLLRPLAKRMGKHGTIFEDPESATQNTPIRNRRDDEAVPADNPDRLTVAHPSPRTYMREMQLYAEVHQPLHTGNTSDTHRNAPSRQAGESRMNRSRQAQGGTASRAHRPQARHRPSQGMRNYSQEYRRAYGDAYNHRPSQMNPGTHDTLDRDHKRPRNRGQGSPPETMGYEPDLPESPLSGYHMHGGQFNNGHYDPPPRRTRGPSDNDVRVNLVLMPEHLNERGMDLLRLELGILTGKHAPHSAIPRPIPDINMADGDGGFLAGEDGTQEKHNPLPEVDDVYEKQLSSPRTPEDQVLDTRTVKIASPQTPRTPASTISVAAKQMPQRQPRRGGSEGSGKGSQRRNRRVIKNNEQVKTTGTTSTMSPGLPNSEWRREVNVRVGEIERKVKTLLASSSGASTTTPMTPRQPRRARRGAGTPRPAGPAAIVPPLLSTIKPPPQDYAGASPATVRPSTPPPPGHPLPASVSSLLTPPQRRDTPPANPVFNREPDTSRGGSQRTATTASDPDTSWTSNSVTSWKP